MCELALEKKNLILACVLDEIHRTYPLKHIGEVATAEEIETLYYHLKALWEL